MPKKEGLFLCRDELRVLLSDSLSEVTKKSNGHVGQFYTFLRTYYSIISCGTYMYFMITL